MKRAFRTLILAAPILLVLALCLAGCASRDPFHVLQKAIQKNAKLSSAQFSAALQTDASIQGIPIQIPASIELEMAGIHTENITAALHLSLDAAGTSVEADSYYSDGWFYVHNEKIGKIRYPMSLEEFRQKLRTVQALPELSREDFSELTMKKQEEDLILSYTLNRDALDIPTDFLPDALSIFPEDISLDIDVPDIRGTITINQEGYISSSVMTLPLTARLNLAGQEQNASLEIHLELSCIHPGEEILPRLPDDLSDYERIGVQNRTAFYRKRQNDFRFARFQRQICSV